MSFQHGSWLPAKQANQEAEGLLTSGSHNALSAEVY